MLLSQLRTQTLHGKGEGLSDHDASQRDKEGGEQDEDHT